MRLLVALALCFHAAPGVAKDLTADVLAKTDLGQRVVAFCATNCQGNERKGELRRVEVTRLDESRFAVEVEAHLRNRQHQAAPPILGGLVGKSLTLFDYTAVVIADGTLDGASCNIRIDSIRIRDDRLGLGKALARERGKIYRVPDCKKLLVGL